MNDLLLFPFIIFISLLLTELVRRNSLKKNFLDTPNERSSHSIATPHGGGLSIVIVFLAAVGLSGTLPFNIAIAFIGSGALVAAIGFWDGHEHIAAKWRLLSHFIAVFWALFWLGGIPVFQLLGYNVDAGWVGIVIMAFILVWLLNLFNFMDGIDGIAASEAIFVACGGACFSWLNGLENLSFISLILAASTAGFLILNWAPAKIFMGDVGSCFLGLMLGILAYANIVEGGLIWIWFILWAVFLVDSGITLFRRILKGERWYEAHCSHAYQHAARKWGHKRVTISVIIINLFWLFPLAAISYLKPDFGAWFTLLAYAPLIIIAIKFKAGINDNNLHIIARRETTKQPQW